MMNLRHNTLTVGNGYWNKNSVEDIKDKVKLVLPSKKDLYEAKINSKYNLIDIRHMINQLKKGDIKMFQLVFSEELTEDESINKCLNVIRGKGNLLLDEYRYELLKSAKAELKQYRKVLIQNIDWEEDKETLSNIYTLVVIISYLYKYKNPFKEWFNNKHYLTVLDIRKSGYKVYPSSKMYRELDMIDIKDINSFKEKEKPAMTIIESSIINLVFLNVVMEEIIV